MNPMYTEYKVGDLIHLIIEVAPERSWNSFFIRGVITNTIPSKKILAIIPSLIIRGYNLGLTETELDGTKVWYETNSLNSCYNIHLKDIKQSFLVKEKVFNIKQLPSFDLRLKIHRQIEISSCMRTDVKKLEVFPSAEIDSYLLQTTKTAEKRPLKFSTLETLLAKRVSVDDKTIDTFSKNRSKYHGQEAVSSFYTRKRRKELTGLSKTLHQSKLLQEKRTIFLQELIKHDTKVITELLETTRDVLNLDYDIKRSKEYVVANTENHYHYCAAIRHRLQRQFNYFRRNDIKRSLACYKSWLFKNNSWEGLLYTPMCRDKEPSCREFLQKYEYKLNLSCSCVYCVFNRTATCFENNPIFIPKKLIHLYENN